MSPRTRMMRAWLRAGAAAVVAAGVVCLASVHPATELPWVTAMDLVQWPLDGNPGPPDFATRATSAMLGGVMIGWGATLLLLPYRRDSRPAMLAGLVAWFLCDSAGSLLCGFTGNLGVNLLFVAVLAPPIVFMGDP